MTIKSTAELSLKDIEQLLKGGKVEEVSIKDDSFAPKGKTYSIFDLYLIKLKIQEFLKDCPNLDPQNPTAEKEIFTYIYLKLAQIAKYDDFVYDLKNNRDSFYLYMGEDLISAAAGLDGIFIHGEAVCLGFAEALRNLLAEKEISAAVLTGGPKTLAEAKKLHKSGHAWNQVYLDNKWFNCDVTFDINNILSEKPLRYFLKSNKDFSHYKNYPLNTNQTIEPATSTLSNEETNELVSKLSLVVTSSLLTKTEDNKKPKLISSILTKLNFFKTRTTPKQFE